jgi:citrate lyase synthetase
MVFIFSPRPNIREYIGVESTLTVITGKSSPVLKKLAAKQGSHQSQQVREIAEFSRNNKIISHSCVRQAALKEKQHQRPIRMPGFKPVV